ncbi:MAG: hypothetical protein ABGX22_17630 [Pirellulaceae bacterium]
MRIRWHLRLQVTETGHPVVQIIDHNKQYVGPIFGSVCMSNE